MDGFATGLVCGTLGVAAVAFLGSRARETHGRWAAATVVIHPAACLVLFFSLAARMHRSLGGWPRTLGDGGFPDGLALHADLARFAFGSLLLGCLFALPAAAVLCAVVPRLRRALRDLGLHAIASASAFATMSAAPEPFLSWWWD